jgi:hypothetical protein
MSLTDLAPCFLVDLEHDEAKLDLQRRGESHAALAAFLDVVFRLFEFVVDVFKRGDVSEKSVIGNTERNTASSPEFSRASGFTFIWRNCAYELALHLDEVGKLAQFADPPEILAHPFAVRERQRHDPSLS